LEAVGKFSHHTFRAETLDDLGLNSRVAFEHKLNVSVLYKIRSSAGAQIPIQMFQSDRLIAEFDENRSIDELTRSHHLASCNKMETRAGTVWACLNSGPSAARRVCMVYTWVIYTHYSCSLMVMAARSPKTV